ncbi:MAG: hypothetical protein JW956_04475 [Calditrichaceae bacterium]|nr:hypothetical protein [Calditrichaceae bacterium]
MSYKTLLFIILLVIVSVQAQDKIEIPLNSGFAFSSDEPIVTPVSDPYNYYQKTDAPDMVGQKSTGLAFFMSLALPGSGEFYMGRKNLTAWFLTTEILLWTGLTANSLYADHLTEECRIYASQHAGVVRDGKDKQYWVDIGKYNSIYDFNEQRRRDRYFEAIYYDESADYWLWDSKDSRLKYDGNRLGANEIKNQSVYFFASIVLNHLVSAVNSLRIARKHNRELGEKANWSLGIKTYKIETQNYYGLNFSTSF